MREIEMKILNIPRKVVFAKMKKLGAVKKYTVLLRVKYFDFPDLRIHKKKDLLRIRETIFLPNRKRKTEVVYKICKGVKKGCKIFDELEFWLEEKNGFKMMNDFLKRLGFVQTLYYEKRRTLFIYKHWKFEFDEHPKIPPLLEIEAENENEVNKIVKKLGVEVYEKTPETIEQLMKRKYPHISLQNLFFMDR